MKRILFYTSLVLLTLAFTACGSKGKQETETVEETSANSKKANEYCNEKYGFCINFPENAFTIDEASVNEDGAVLVSPDGFAKLVVHRGNLKANVFGAMTELSKAHEEDIKPIGKRQITLNSQKTSYYVLNGYENKTIFYQKTAIIKGQIVTAVLYYEDSAKNTYYPMIVPIFKSFE